LLPEAWSVTSTYTRDVEDTVAANTRGRECAREVDRYLAMLPARRD
jgi:hypothetical protein